MAEGVRQWRVDDANQLNQSITRVHEAINSRESTTTTLETITIRRR